MKKILISLVVIMALAGCSSESKEENHSGTTEEKNEDIELVQEEEPETIKQYEEPAQFVHELLKSGQFTVDYLEEQVAPPQDSSLSQEEMDKLADTMLTNLADNMDWYQSEMEKLELSDQDKLPYDPKFGITEEEYNLLSNVWDQIELVKTREGQLKIQKVDGKIGIAGKSTGNVLTKVGIDLENNKILTEFGIATYDRKIEANENQILTGIWNGYCWKIAESTHDFEFLFTDLNICIGQLVESGETIIYNNAGLIDNFGVVMEVSELIKFQGNKP
ncbi:hypothetical protein [Chengkuizengella axinellae]|uniref:Lipoprotein n=1 Tax=Chengkuizengella axinellae TaxID=3064388 RepID=A0ABT9J548_9BACL|nr:hypothetical protein [Chengkuizengella sp. 2205SS18-9]MDP5276120.1 hypothetical protein [Chengkuizengella sp. 2205SS18-9]